ncbi:preprotein translocase subunit SecE [Candidatus Microgenomates bacterium]|nr:preprotein translocase subunit SecE [Candidatus Microgenomates bacterium]
MTTPVTFLKEVRFELNKVEWPSREQALRLTGVVIAISVAVGLFIGLWDFIFFKIMEVLL